MVENAGFEHEVSDQIEVWFARGERGVCDAIAGEGVTQQGGRLVEVEAAHEVGGFLTMGRALVEPETGAGDAVDELLHGLRALIDEFLANYEHT